MLCFHCLVASARPETQLALNLEFYEFQVRPKGWIRADNHSLYDAVADQELTQADAPGTAWIPDGRERCSALIRSALALWLLQNSDHPSLRAHKRTASLDTKEAWDNYCKSVAASAPGDEIVLSAVAEKYRRPVTVVSAHHPLRSCVSTLISSDKRARGTPIFLSLLNGVYNSLVG